MNHAVEMDRRQPEDVAADVLQELNVD